MTAEGLKRYTPRSLYGRATLILLLPVVTIQLVVSVVFIQRLFEDVTEQMTETVSIQLAPIVSRVAQAPDPQAALARAAPLARSLGVDIALPAPAPIDADRRDLFDLSGRIVIATLREEYPAITGIDLASDDKRVAMTLPTRNGLLRLDVARDRVSASNPHQLLVLMVGTSLLMTVVAYLFLRNQLRPIKRLAEAASAFGKGRVVPYRPAGATEVRAAGAAFLDMRNRIERQIEQRTMMLSGVSHDLRTPLTRLRLGLSMIEEDEETRAMERDIAEMEAMLNAFLDFSRSEALEPLVEADPETLLRDLAENARRAGQDVEIVSVSGAGSAHLRPLAVTRALENLVGNAVRHGRRAALSLGVGARAVVFTVEDDGPGIPPDEREEATKPFSQLDPSRNQDRGGGVGLGLAIAMDIARQHGGTLRLERSDRLGGLKADLVIAR